MARLTVQRFPVSLVSHVATGPSQGPISVASRMGIAGLPGWRPAPNANGHEPWTPRTERATITSVEAIAWPKGKSLNMSELHRITIEPGKCGGRPCLRGLRVRVKDVLDLLAAGATRDEILEDLPYLEARGT